MLATFGVQVWLLCKISSFIFQKEKDKNRVCHCSYATGQLGRFRETKHSLLTSICLKLMVNFRSNDFCKLFMNDILLGSPENIMILWADCGLGRGFTSNGCSAIARGLALLTCLSITGAVLRYNHLREPQRYLEHTEHTPSIQKKTNERNLFMNCWDWWLGILFWYVPGRTIRNETVQHPVRLEETELLGLLGMW